MEKGQEVMNILIRLLLFMVGSTECALPSEPGTSDAGGRAAHRHGGLSGQESSWGPLHSSQRKPGGRHRGPGPSWQWWAAKRRADCRENWQELVMESRWEVREKEWKLTHAQAPGLQDWGGDGAFPRAAASGHVLCTQD